MAVDNCKTCPFQKGYNYRKRELHGRAVWEEKKFQEHLKKMMSQIGLIGEYMDGAKFRDIISLV